MLLPVTLSRPEAFQRVTPGKKKMMRLHGNATVDYSTADVRVGSMRVHVYLRMHHGNYGEEFIP